MGQAKHETKTETENLSSTNQTVVYEQPRTVQYIDPNSDTKKKKICLCFTSEAQVNILIMASLCLCSCVFCICCSSFSTSAAYLATKPVCVGGKCSMTSVPQCLALCNVLSCGPCDMPKVYQAFGMIG